MIEKAVDVEANPIPPAEALQYRPAATISRGWWTRGRQDGPLKRLVINLVLAGACVVAIYRCSRC